jgi:hypothetical protein
MSRRTIVALAAACAAFALTPASAHASGGDMGPVAQHCGDNGSLCTEPADPYTYEGTYIGHDEPSVLFYSGTPGAGNNQLYHLQLPTDSGKIPTQSGTGGTWNFQLHPAFWFGMALCDDQSAPNPGGSTLAGPNVPCAADSDSNIYTGTTPTAQGGTNYIGRHPGTAFMELQFYPPGWVTEPITDACSGTQWCAALTIDSDALNQNTNRFLNSTCADQLFGNTEYVNFAYITKSGAPMGPANPLQVNDATFDITNPDLLLMNSGDQLTVDLHDTAHGVQVVIHDLTTGRSGSMTASAANSFGAIEYAPTGTSCTLVPWDFHPEYATSSEATRVVWAAHGYNVAYSDEIGHWEYCNAANFTADFSTFPFPCTSAGVSDANGVDGDDIFCLPGSISSMIDVTGCTQSDEDFDGVSYQPVWPGVAHDMATSSTPGAIVFSSPTFNGGQQYARVAFETDLPRIEATGLSPNNSCDRFSPAGTGCVDPPNGANFYPMFVARQTDQGCRWFEGGPNFPGKTQTFGGTPTAEYGPILRLDYPTPAGDGPRINDFRNVLPFNPCPS